MRVRVWICVCVCFYLPQISQPQTLQGLVQAGTTADRCHSWWATMLTTAHVILWAPAARHRPHRETLDEAQRSPGLNGTPWMELQPTHSLTAAVFIDSRDTHSDTAYHTDIKHLINLSLNEVSLRCLSCAACSKIKIQLWRKIYLDFCCLNVNFWLPFPEGYSF